jgi:hypothetical protein
MGMHLPYSDHCPLSESYDKKAVMAKSGYFEGIDYMMRSHGTSRETLRYPGGFSARHIRQRSKP